MCNTLLLEQIDIRTLYATMIVTQQNTNGILPFQKEVYKQTFARDSTLHLRLDLTRAERLFCQCFLSSGLAAKQGPYRQSPIFHRTHPVEHFVGLHGLFLSDSAEVNRSKFINNII